VRFWGGQGRRRAARRRPAADAAGAWVPVSLGFGQDNARVGKLHGVLGKVPAVRVGCYDDRRVELSVGALADSGGPASDRKRARAMRNSGFL
jgi:hypothetical protein